MAMNDREAITNFLRAEFRREQETGFALLRRIPNTSIRQLLDYFMALDKQGQNLLAEAFSKIALHIFFPSDHQSNPCSLPAYKKYNDAMSIGWDWKYCTTQELRMFLAEAERNPEYSRQARGMTPEVLEKIRAIKPVKSTEIRKVVKLALSQLLPDVKITQEAGHWCYRGSYQSQDVCIAIDYSARYTQLRYDVSVSDKERGINLKGLTFERTMGILIMGWDCLEQANLDQSIALLTDLILYCVELPKRLPA